MKRRELTYTVRYFTSAQPGGFRDNTLYVAHEPNGRIWFIRKPPGTPSARALCTSLQDCLRRIQSGHWKEVILPDSVLYDRENGPTSG